MLVRCVPIEVSSTYFLGDEAGLSSGAIRTISLGGTIFNLVLGLVFLAALRIVGTRPQKGRVRNAASSRRGSTTCSGSGRCRPGECLRLHLFRQRVPVRRLCDDYRGHRAARADRERRRRRCAVPRIAVGGGEARRSSARQREGSPGPSLRARAAPEGRNERSPLGQCAPEPLSRGSILLVHRTPLSGDRRLGNVAVVRRRRNRRTRAAHREKPLVVGDLGRRRDRGCRSVGTWHPTIDTRGARITPR